MSEPRSHDQQPLALRIPAMSLIGYQVLAPTYMKHDTCDAVTAIHKTKSFSLLPLTCWAVQHGAL